MNLLVAIGLIATVLALAFLVGTGRSLRRGRIVRAGSNCVAAAASAALAGLALLLAFSYLSYGRLTAETVVSHIHFRALAPGEYEARLMVDGLEDRLYRLRGDEWQLDARVISWKSPATILGLDPIYRLERLSGRYADIDRERSEAKSVHALAPEELLDIWAVARRFPYLTPGVDAYYGTATYVPMADGARFEVSLSRDALIARPANEAARRALGRWRTDSATP